MASPFFCFSFSVSLLFFSFFLPSCLYFLLSFCFLFLSLSFLFFLHCFCFMKRKHQNIQLQFFPEIFSLSFGFLSCFSVSNPFFLSLLFPDFKLCFLFNINVFLVSKEQIEKHKKKQKKNNCNKTGFFYEPVFCKMSKAIVFFFASFFCQILVDVQKHYKNRYFGKF